MYRLLRASAAELTGTDFLTGDKSTVDERIDQWQERLTSKEVGLTAGSANNVLGILARMFPRLSRFGGALQKAAAKSISSPEYFGRYLSYRSLQTTSRTPRFEQRLTRSAADRPVSPPPAFWANWRLQAMSSSRALPLLAHQSLGCASITIRCHSNGAGS